MICCYYIDMLLLQDGWTALHFACRNGRTEIVKYLLTNGASLSAANKVNHNNCLIKLQNVISCKF